jgi:hypothetical protein
MSNQPKIKFTRRKSVSKNTRGWDVIIDGRTFIATAESRWYNSNPGHGCGATVWDLFVWENNSHISRDLLPAHGTETAPRGYIEQAIRKHVELNPV